MIVPKTMLSVFAAYRCISASVLRPALEAIPGHFATDHSINFEQINNSGADGLVVALQTGLQGVNFIFRVYSSCYSSSMYISIKFEIRT